MWGAGPKGRRSCPVCGYNAPEGFDGWICEECGCELRAEDETFVVEGMRSEVDRLLARGDRIINGRLRSQSLDSCQL